MHSVIFNLKAGDVFIFTDDPNVTYKVAGVWKYHGGSCGMGEYPGGIFVFCTTGHYFSCDSWTCLTRCIQVISEDNDFKKQLEI